MISLVGWLVKKLERKIQKRLRGRNYDQSIARTLKKQNKINHDFENKLALLTLEELIALSNELAQGILNNLISQGENKVLEKKEELIDIINQYKIPFSYRIVDPTIALQELTQNIPLSTSDGEND